MLVSTVFAAPVGSRFSYQGQLQVSNSAANGLYDLHFSIWDNVSGMGQLGGDLILDDVDVVNGLFSVELDFGDVPFDGDDVFLEIRIREGVSTGSFTFISPRQRINATPYATQAEFLAANGATTGQILQFDGTNWVAANIGTGTSPWSPGFGGTQYIGDVVIGDLVASAGDTLQILSQVNESPLRILVGGVGTRFRVSKNGGTGVGANYSDGQIPANGLRVAGNVQLGKTSIGSSPDLAPGNGLNVEGTVLAKSDMKVYRNLAIGPNASFAGSTSLQINSESGRSPLRIKINNSTKMRIYTNGGTSLGGNTTPETNGLVVQGTVLARSHVEIGNVNISGSGAPPELAINGVNPLSVQVNGTTRLNVSDVGGVGIGGNSGFQIPQNGLYVNGDAKLNSDLILTGKPKQDINSHGFAKAGIKFHCGNLPLPIFNSFNNINSGSILVLPHVIPGGSSTVGVCRIQFPFPIGNLFIQTRTDAESDLYIRATTCKIKSGSSTVLECGSQSPDTGTFFNSIVTMLLF